RGDITVQRNVVVQEGRKYILTEIEYAPTLPAVEHGGIEHVDTGIHRIADDLSPRRFLDELRDALLGVGNDDSLLQRGPHARERPRGDRLFFVMKLDQIGQIDIGDRVAADNEEWAIEPLLRELDRTGRAQRRLLDRVMNFEAKRFAVAKIILNRGRHELQRH